MVVEVVVAIIVSLAILAAMWGVFIFWQEKISDRSKKAIKYKISKFLRR